MTPLEFIAKVLEVLSWPVASVVLVVLLQNEIRALVPSLRKFKAGPIEAEFELRIEHVAAVVETQPEAEGTLSRLTMESLSKAEMPTVSPRAAVLEAWLRVEAAANDAIGRHVVKMGGSGAMSSRLTHGDIAQRLLREELIQAEQVEILNDLRQLRNKVVHAHEFAPTHEAIERYKDSAAYLVWWLNKDK